MNTFKLTTIIITMMMVVGMSGRVIHSEFVVAKLICRRDDDDSNPAHLIP